MENLEYEELKILANITKKTLSLNWTGSIHASNPGEFLSPYLDEVIEISQEKGYKVISDFSKLDYMNSASIPPLIQLLRDLNENQIYGEFIYDATRKVQAASFKALDVIAKKSSYTRVTGNS